jgi:hypothetical protein
MPGQGKGFAYDLGEWKIIALNSEIVTVNLSSSRAGSRIGSENWRATPEVRVAYSTGHVSAPVATPAA